MQKKSNTINPTNNFLFTHTVLTVELCWSVNSFKFAKQMYLQNDVKRIKVVNKIRPAREVTIHHIKEWQFISKCNIIKILTVIVCMYRDVYYIIVHKHEWINLNTIAIKSGYGKHFKLLKHKPFLHCIAIVPHTLTHIPSYHLQWWRWTWRQQNRLLDNTF